MIAILIGAILMMLSHSDFDLYLSTVGRIKHLFMYLLTTCINFSLQKCLFMSFTNVFNWTVCFSAKTQKLYKFFVYNALYSFVYYPLQIFFPFHRMSFHYVITSSALQMLSCPFDVVAFVYFLFCCLCFRCHNQKNLCQDLCQRVSFPSFLLEVLWFQILHLGL